MKKIKLLIPAFLLFTSCGGGLTQFNMDYDQSFIVPSSVGINLPFNVITPDIESNSESTFESNDTRKDLIESIILTELNLTVSAPSNGDFSFLNEVRIYMDADGLDEIELAWLDNIPANPGKTIVLETTGAEMREYIKKDQFDLRLYTVTDEIITSDHQLDMHSNFFVDAKLFK